MVKDSRRQGRVLLVATFLYGIAAILLRAVADVWLAVGAALLLGAFDAMATTIRHAAVQIDTPDELRGRVQAFYQMSSRGGPAIGDVVMGAFAGVVGPVVALTRRRPVPVLVGLALLPGRTSSATTGASSERRPGFPADPRPRTAPEQRCSGAVDLQWVT